MLSEDKKKWFHWQGLIFDWLHISRHFIPLVCVAPFTSLTLLHKNLINTLLNLFIRQLFQTAMHTIIIDV